MWFARGKAYPWLCNSQRINQICTVIWSSCVRLPFIVKKGQVGNYEAELIYAFSQEDIGSVLKVRSEEHALQTKITEAFESIIKDQDDRVSRDES